MNKTSYALAGGDQDDLKVGLVLSGGGAKGIAHIGVLKALEEAGIRVDYIAGTSMGSIIGALYATGISVEEMEIMASSTEWDFLFSDSPARRNLSMFEKELEQRFILSFPINQKHINLPKALISGQNIIMWLNRQFWPVLEETDFNNFSIPFATVATDLGTGEAVVFNSGNLTNSIRASISFPSILSPFVVDNKILVDGGLVRNLPVIEVWNMGADYVIAVDASGPLHPADELESITSILSQAIGFRINDHVMEQKLLADLLISIPELNKYSILDFEYAEKFIEAGEFHARQHGETFKEIVKKQNQEIPLKNQLTKRESLKINRISVQGNEHIPDDFVLNEFKLKAGSHVTVDDIESSVSMLYSTKLFDIITYQVEKEIHGGQNDSYHLILKTIENTDDLFSVGVRFETDTQAAIRLHANFRNIVLGGTNLRLDLRVGRDMEITGDYLLFAGLGSKMALKVQLKYYSERVDHYQDYERVSTLTNNVIRSDLFFGNFMNNFYLIGMGIRRDVNFFTSKVNRNQIPFSNADHHAIYGKFLLDSFNRRSFTTRGHQLLVQATFSDELFLSPVTFNEQRILWTGWYPVSSYFSFQHTLFLGRSAGDELPWTYWFAPNRRQQNIGIIRFGGFNRYELAGRNFQMASAGMQYEFSRHRFLRMDFYAGNALEDWNLSISENQYLTGYSFSAGALTKLGPVEAIISTSSRNRFLYELQVGYEF